MVVAVDADHLVPPDPRGCELLVEHADLAVPIVCAWLEERRLCSRTGELRCWLPHPSAYRGVAAPDVAAFAERLAAQCRPCAEAREKQLHDAAREEALRAINPFAHAAYVSYAAGAASRGGAVRVCSAVGLQGREVGLDAVARLSAWLEDWRWQGDPPELLLVSDQWGVLHAPTATGRVYLLERGFGDVALLLHDGSGELLRLRCSDLAGVPPREEAAGAAEPGPQ
mmetsp:Transcript_38785/g.104016  ORF Transcript_38785/g.104016 Transcript_38785/m.104016 type:complete len:226 (+) Transcript_38785:2-679(+)